MTRISTKEALPPTIVKRKAYFHSHNDGERIKHSPYHGGNLSILERSG